MDKLTLLFFFEGDPIINCLLRYLLLEKQIQSIRLFRGYNQKTYHATHENSN